MVVEGEQQQSTQGVFGILSPARTSPLGGVVRVTETKYESFASKLANVCGWHDIPLDVTGLGDAEPGALVFIVLDATGARSRDDIKRMMLVRFDHLQQNLGEFWQITVSGSPSISIDHTSLVYNDGEAMGVVDALLARFSTPHEPQGHGDASVAELGQTLESISTLLTLYIDALDITGAERRTAEAIGTFLAAVDVEDPPRAALRGALSWLQGKFDKAPDGFATAFGTAAGTAAGVTATASVAGKLPDLLRLIEKGIGLLS